MIDTILQIQDKIDIFCLGTPRINGDAIGPLVGSMLKQHSFDKDVKIIGDLDAPVTYTNYNNFLCLLRKDAFVIVVDANVGYYVGTYDIVLEPTHPGASLNTGIPPVGDMSVKAYTGRTLQGIVKADTWDVTLLGYRITTELKDLLQLTKNKVYIEDKIVI